MKSSLRGLAFFVTAIALTSACGGYSVSYEGVRNAKKGKGDIAVYDIDCRDPVLQPADCQFQGGPMPWAAIGVFRAPKKALSGWDKYRGKVTDAAAANGCPAVAIRRMPPGSSDGGSIGAFCVDPANPNMPTAAATPGAPGPGGVGISVSATITAPVYECNGPSECPPGMKCTRGVCTP